MLLLMIIESSRASGTVQYNQSAKMKTITLLEGVLADSMVSKSPDSNYLKTEGC
jgi:hypothetical protein